MPDHRALPQHRRPAAPCAASGRAGRLAATLRAYLAGGPADGTCTGPQVAACVGELSAEIVTIVGSLGEVLLAAAGEPEGARLHEALTAANPDPAERQRALQVLEGAGCERLWHESVELSRLVVQANQTLPTPGPSPAARLRRLLER